jgi:hypothetical protein
VNERVFGYKLYVKGKGKEGVTHNVDSVKEKEFALIFRGVREVKE